MSPLGLLLSPSINRPLIIMVMDVIAYMVKDALQGEDVIIDVGTASVITLDALIKLLISVGRSLVKLNGSKML